MNRCNWFFPATSELNIEHGRKRNRKSLLDNEPVTKTDSPPSINSRMPSITGTSDARLESLINLECKYMELMTSDKVPIYSSVDEALSNSDTIFHDDIIRKRVRYILGMTHCVALLPLQNYAMVSVMIGDCPVSPVFSASLTHHRACNFAVAIVLQSSLKDREGLAGPSHNRAFAAILVTEEHRRAQCSLRWITGSRQFPRAPHLRSVNRVYLINLL